MTTSGAMPSASIWTLILCDGWTSSKPTYRLDPWGYLDPEARPLWQPVSSRRRCQNPRRSHCPVRGRSASDARSIAAAGPRSDLHLQTETLSRRPDHLGALPRTMMILSPNGFSNGWHEKQEKRWRRWYDAIQRDRNYARILLGLPLIEPIRTEVRQTADRLGYRWPQTSQADRTTESRRPQDPARPAQAPDRPRP